MVKILFVVWINLMYSMIFPFMVHYEIWIHSNRQTVNEQKSPANCNIFSVAASEYRFCWKVWKYKQHLIMISIGWLQGSFEMTLVPMWQNGKLTSAPASSTTHWPLRAWTKIQRLAESHLWQFLEMVTLTSLMVPRTMDGAVVIPVEKGSQHSSPLWH